MIYVKIHKGNEEVIAVCDKGLIGKKFTEGKLCLDIKESFYKDELVEKDKVKEILNNATNLNIVGEESINLAIKEKIIDESSVIRIKGIPHAQIYSI